MFSKPCERGGCTGVATASCASRLVIVRFCSQRCAYLERVRLGTWLKSELTPALRRKGAKRAGRIVGDRRRKEAVLRAASKLSGFVPDRLALALDPPDLILIRVLLARAYRQGYKTGYACGYGPRGAQRKESRAA